MHIPRRALVISGAAALILGGGAAAAFASIPDSGGVIHGCYGKARHAPRDRHWFGPGVRQGRDGPELESDRATGGDWSGRADWTTGGNRTTRPGRTGRCDWPNGTINGRARRPGRDNRDCHRSNWPGNSLLPVRSPLRAQWWLDNQCGQYNRERFIPCGRQLG